MTPARSSLMLAEAFDAERAIAQQFDANAAIIDALAQRLRAERPRFIVTCARGSSDHAATYAKYLFETRLGLVTASASPSVSSIYGASTDLRGALFIAISQSGRSPDLLRNVEQARRSGALTVAFVNVEDSPLAAAVDVVVPLGAGPERSVAATKSYLCSLSALAHLAARWTRDDDLDVALRALPAQLRASWDGDWTSLSDGLVDVRNLFVIGRGLGLGAAQEAALKLKETCALHAEAYSAAEVRHGPMTLVDEGFPVLFLLQDDDTAAGTLELADEFERRGARVWIAGASPDRRGALPIAPGVAPAVAPLLLVRSFYRAVDALAARRGLDPDVPRHLRKVTETV
jgi:glutamine---fructose-6-phosphate transaminase (isomerizing)